MKPMINLCGCILIWSIALAAVAQEVTTPATPQDPQSLPTAPAESDDAEQVENADDSALPDRPPAREIAFEISEDDEELPLFRPDPELLEQRYVAYVTIRIPRQVGPSGRHDLSRYAPPEVVELARVEQFVLLTGTRHIDSVSKKEFFSRLAKSIVDDSPAWNERMQFFLSDAVEEGLVSISEVRSSERGEVLFRFRILAPTEQLARERSETLIRMLDGAITRPLLQHLQAGISPRAESLDMLQQKLADAEEAGTQLDEQFAAKGESVVEAEELKQLTTERRLLDVDLAGIRARIDAADDILSKLRNNRGAENIRRRIEQLEDIKITAEIDLAGLAARREMLDQIIREGKLWEALVARVDQKHTEIRNLRRQIGNVTNGLEELREVFIETAETLFTLKDDKVVIHPIKWTGN